MANKETDERNEIVLALKEIQRQFEAMRARVGAEPLDEALSSDLPQRLLAQLQKLREGRISPEDAQAENQAIGERIDRDTAASDDPALVMAHRSENEAGSKGLPQIAQLLASDAGSTGRRGSLERGMDY